MADYTVQYRRRDQMFIVRKDARFVAAFANHEDAELFATMMGCDSCGEDVANHLHIKGNEHTQGANERATLRRQFTEVSQRFDIDGA